MTYLKKRILIIDKEGDIKSILRLLLANADKYILLGDYNSFEEAQDIIDKLAPSVILLGLELEGMNGIEAAKKLAETHPQIKAVLITPHETPEIIYESLKAGVSGFIHHKAPYQEVMKHLDEIYRDEAPMNGRIAKTIIGYLRTSKNSLLTRRERELMTMLSYGKNVNEIAANFNISKNTIHRHLANIYHKLEVNNKSDAIEKAVRDKLI